jgi:hypothetical protein
MKLTAYALNDDPPVLRAARPQREWMSAFTDQHAYRCLPMTIANAHGWEVLMPVTVEIEWTGGMEAKDLTVRADKPLPGGRPLEHFCRSNFARGIVTFHTDYIFRTDDGWDLFVTGPVNSWTDNAAPLTGIVESDWLPYPFTMNWQILHPGKAVFAEGEPFCVLFPIAKQALLDVEPEIRRLADDPELAAQHQAFRESRDGFMQRIADGDRAAQKQGWQRHYFLGRHPDGTTVAQHLNRLRLKEPVDRRGQPAPRARSDPRWEDDSPFNIAPEGQTAANDAGRQRIDDRGHLAAATRVVRSQKEAEGLDLLVIDNLLGEADCAALCEVFARMEDKVFKDRSGTIDPFWQERFVWYTDIKAAHPEAAKLMYDAHKRGIMLASMFYRLKAPVYADLLQIVRWRQGMFMRPHADNANPDGAPHGMAYRALAGVYYLNDDYEGGELYFTALDVAIKPKRGMFVAMMGGFHHEHGVTRIETGTRLTLPFFLTFDKAKADSDLL